MKKLNYKPLFTEKVLAKRIAEIGAQMTKDLKGEPVTLITVLKGSFIFAADLIRQIKGDVQIEFIGVSSYAGTESTGNVRITSDLYTDIEGRNVVLVEDIIDTGRTIDYLVEVLTVRKPKSLKICTLLSKPEAHVMHHDIDYVGFEISNEFVVGYGLDLDQEYRGLPFIAQVQD